MNSSQLHQLPAAGHLRAVATAGHRVDGTGADRLPRSRDGSTAPDVRAAAALLEATTRMHDSTDPQALLLVIASEALRFLAADGVVVLAHDRNGATPVLHLPRSGDGSDDGVTQLLCLRLAAAHLLEPGQIADLDELRTLPDELAGGDDARAALGRWRSVLVADLHSSRSSRPTRLLWYATTPDAFHTSGDLAAVFARHAGLALRNVGERHHLEQAVESRTVTGQATGILMNRYQLTAARAFEILRRCSQERNLRIRDVADTLNRTGELPT